MIALVPRDSLVGLIIGPLIWGGYFTLNYIISGVGCSLGYNRFEFAGLSAVQWAALAAGAVAVLLIAVAAFQANRGRLHVLDAAERGEHAAQRHDFLYTNALILCGLSLVGAIWLAMAAAVAPIC